MNTETIQEVRDEFFAASAKARRFMVEKLEDNRDAINDLRMEADSTVRLATELLIEQEARGIADEWLENEENYDDAHDFVGEQVNSSRMVFITWEAECVASQADDDDIEEAHELSCGEILKVETIAYCVLLRKTLDLIYERKIMTENGTQQIGGLS